MKLRTLDARFIKHQRVIATWRRVKADVFAQRPSGPFAESDLEDVTGPQDQTVDVTTLSEADGIRFLCPKCWFDPPIGAEGTHSVICWFTGKVPDDVVPNPGRWNPTGTSLDDLSFVPGIKSHSVLLLGGCGWHGLVTHGDAT